MRAPDAFLNPEASMPAVAMKTQHIKVDSHTSDKRPGVLAAFITVLLTFSFLPEIRSQDLFWTGTAANPAVAGSGSWVTPEPPGVITWSSSSTSFVGANWVDGSVAHFLGSNGGTATLGSNITAAGIYFDPGANAFTIDTNLNTLSIEGAGIVNNSGKTQTIINNGGTVSGAPGGSTAFHNVSTAGGATITNNGSAVKGAAGGVTIFSLSSTAGNATIITNGETNGGEGAATRFTINSNGGTARAITNGNGTFDISGLNTPGMAIGSLEGSGIYFLGSKTLTVGGNNLSTTVSGVIQDSGFYGGAGGSLTKVGTGTLTLPGPNTYTGATTENAGSLIVDGSIASQQTFVNAGGSLGGHGTIGGDLVNSGTVSQFNSPGTLTVVGNYTQNPGGTLRISVGGLAPSQHEESAEFAFTLSHPLNNPIG
jgi:autotransporter-associated beta strand protein